MGASNSEVRSVPTFGGHVVFVDLEHAVVKVTSLVAALETVSRLGKPLTHAQAQAIANELAGVPK